MRKKNPIEPILTQVDCLATYTPSELWMAHDPEVLDVCGLMGPPANVSNLS